ncbi:MAG: hypothetical protein ACTHMX_15065 [Thermomicrobiales bacterium]
MPESPAPPPLSTPPDADTVRAMLAMLGIEVATDDPRLPVLVEEMAGQLRFARLIDEVLADVPAEAVAGAVGTFDPAWSAEAAS